MNDFVYKLREEVDQKIREIETAESNVLKRALAVSEMLEEVFDRLKRFIADYTFSSDEEEIYFFKESKPRFFCKLLFYRKVYNIEMNMPMGSYDAQIDYLKKQQDDIADYNNKRLDFYRYYRSGSTHLDRCYFLRGRGNPEDQYRDSFYFERDPVFSTCGDFKVAKILCNDMLTAYIPELIQEIDGRKSALIQSPYIPLDLPRWTDKKSGLIEILYSLDTMGSFDNGTLSLRKLQEFFEIHFDVKLGNVARAFNEMRLRQNPTMFLDQMKRALERRIEDTDNRNYALTKPHPNSR